MPAPQIGRAKNSARPACGYIQVLIAPVLSRDSSWARSQNWCELSVYVRETIDQTTSTKRLKTGANNIQGAATH